MQPFVFALLLGGLYCNEDDKPAISWSLRPNWLKTKVESDLSREQREIANYLEWLLNGQRVVPNEPA